MVYWWSFVGVLVLGGVLVGRTLFVLPLVVLDLVLRLGRGWEGDVGGTGDASDRQQQKQGHDERG